MATPGAAAAAASAAAEVRMPRMLYGTAWKKERTAVLVEQAVLAGFRGIDTACQPKHYREDLVGQALGKLQQAHGIPRTSLFLQTKFTSLDGQDRSQPLPYDARAPLAEQVRQSLATSLRNLGTDYLDSLVLHSPMRTHEQSMTAPRAPPCGAVWRQSQAPPALHSTSCPNPVLTSASAALSDPAWPHLLARAVWRQFEAFVAAGQVRQLGVSNIYDLRALQDIYNDADVKPAVVQNRFHSKTGFDREIRLFCRQQGITYQSFWTLTANPDALSSRAVRDAAAKRSCEPEQVWYRFVMQRGITPLNGTTSQQHMAADLQVEAWAQPLSEAEMRDIGLVTGEEV